MLFWVNIFEDQKQMSGWTKKYSARVAGARAKGGGVNETAAGCVLMYFARQGMRAENADESAIFTMYIQTQFLAKLTL